MPPPIPFPLPLPANLTFGPFTIPPTQVFHLSPTRLTYALVNLKPLLPGHILVCPVRRVPRLSQLSPTETTDLFQTVRRVSRTLERVYSASAFNVAVQDGVDAGQSVPHVHVHLIPRRGGDMDGHNGGGDRLYEMMDGEEGDVGREMLIRQMEEWGERRTRKKKEVGGRDFGGPDAEASRKARTSEEMRIEAEWLRGEMEKDNEHDGEDGGECEGVRADPGNGPVGK